jgi:hypothetical protein
LPRFYFILQPGFRISRRGARVVKSDREKALSTIESLLKDIEQSLSQNGELSEECKAAIERLRQICVKEKISPRRQEG